MSDERTVPLFEPATIPSVRVMRTPGQLIGQPVSRLSLALEKLKAAYQQAFDVAFEDRSTPVELRYHLLTLVQMTGHYLSCIAAAKCGEGG